VTQFTQAPGATENPSLQLNLLSHKFKIWDTQDKLVILRNM